MFDRASRLPEPPASLEEQRAFLFAMVNRQAKSIALLKKIERENDIRPLRPLTRCGGRMLLSAMAIGPLSGCGASRETLRISRG
jgi:hypothetical protein